MFRRIIGLKGLFPPRSLNHTSLKDCVGIIPHYATGNIFDEALEDLEQKRILEDFQKQDGKGEAEFVGQDGLRRKKVWAYNPGTRTTFKKMNIVARLVRGINYNEAVAQLTFNDRKPAKILLNLIQSAKGNAIQCGLEPDRLLVSEILVGRGANTLRRIRYHARGRHGIIQKRRTYVKVTLEEVEKKAGEKRLGRYGRLTKTEIRERERFRENASVVGLAEN